jgi:DNA-directed RNA polymerase subunit H
MPTKRTKGSKATKAAEEKAQQPTIAMPRHNLVPPHELLSKEEGEAVLARFSTPIERLPKIAQDDPGLLTDPKVREAREAKENLIGRIVRIKRHSPTAGETEVYRAIIAGKED